MRKRVLQTSVGLVTSGGFVNPSATADPSDPLHLRSLATECSRIFVDNCYDEDEPDFECSDEEAEREEANLLFGRGAGKGGECVTTSPIFGPKNTTLMQLRNR